MSNTRMIRNAFLKNRTKTVKTHLRCGNWEKVEDQAAWKRSYCTTAPTGKANVAPTKAGKKRIRSNWSLPRQPTKRSVGVLKKRNRLLQDVASSLKVTIIDGSNQLDRFSADQAELLQNELRLNICNRRSEKYLKIWSDPIWTNNFWNRISSPLLDTVTMNLKFRNFSALCEQLTMQDVGEKGVSVSSGDASSLDTLRDRMYVEALLKSNSSNNP